MADLSHLLGDVYGDPDGPPVRHEPSAAARTPSVPDWAGDDVLDQAFSTWTPGPPADAPDAERTIMEPVGASVPLDDDLAAALSAALAAAPAPDQTAAAVVDVPAVEPTAASVEPVTPESAVVDFTVANPVVEGGAWPVAQVADDFEQPDVFSTSWLTPAAPEPDMELAVPDLGSVLGEPAHETVFVGDDTVLEEPLPDRPWQRSDDDILPGSRRRGLRLFRR
jgi:hypothetical protein